MSSKPKPKASVGSTIETLIYLLFKKILEKRAGRGKGFKKTNAIKPDHVTQKGGSKFKKTAVVATLEKTENKAIEKIIENEREKYQKEKGRRPTNETLIDRVYTELTDNDVPNVTLDMVFNSTAGQAILTDQFRTTLRSQETQMQEGQTVEQFQEKMEQTTENVNEQLGVVRRERAELKELEQTPEVEAQIREKNNDIARLEEILNRMEQGMIQREEKAIEQRREIKTGVQELAERFEDIKKYNKILSTANLDVKRVGDNKIRLDQKIGLDNKQINRLIQNMPPEYIPTLGAPIRSLFSNQEELDYNTLISGLVGFASVVATGNPAIGPLVSQGVVMINRFFDINFNDLLGLRTPSAVEQKEEIITPVNVPSASVSASSEPRPRGLPTREQDPRPIDLLPIAEPLVDLPAPKPKQKIRTKLPMGLRRAKPVGMNLEMRDFNKPAPARKVAEKQEDIKEILIEKRSIGERVRRLLPSLTPEALEARREAIRITPLEGREAALSAATSAALTAATSGSAVAAVLSTIPAGLLGVAARSISRPQVSNLINYYESQQGRDLDQKTRQKVQNTLELIPASLVGGLVGRYAASGGISEQQIEVDEAIVAETQAKIDQEAGRNKQWAPKQISANPEILGASNQEMYADDIESSLFDYVTPTSEGANGTIKSNALKRSQFMNDQLRYFNSGVFVPYELWTKFTNEQDLDNLALGEKPIISLPEMKFERLDQQNTWDNVAKHQLVNNENTSVGLFDPYRNFSNVDNFWTNTRDSVLYTINP